MTVYYDSGLEWNTLYKTINIILIRVKSDYTCYDKVFTNVSNSQIRNFNLYSTTESILDDDGYTYKLILLSIE